jgi:hypothetical protein
MGTKDGLLGLRTPPHNRKHLTYLSVCDRRVILGVAGAVFRSHLTARQCQLLIP